MSSTASEMMTADERITALTIEKDCRQIKINMIRETRAVDYAK